MRSFTDKIYRRWIYDAVTRGLVKLPLNDTVRILVGYEPQRLLPSPDAFPNTGRWGDSRNDPLADIMGFVKEFYRTDAVPERSFMESYFPRIEAPKRTPAPIVLDNVRLSYPHIKPPKDYVEPLMPQHIAVIAIDYGMTEARVLAAMAEPHVTSIYIDIDKPFGDLPGRFSFDEMLADARKTHCSKIAPIESDEPVKQNGRSAAYLKHDPSKKKGRRR